MDYKDNVVLLLLQLLFHRQQELKNKNKDLDYEQLLKDPIVDREVLERFTKHRLVRLYEPLLCNIQTRGMKTIVQDIFDKGLNGRTADTRVTLISLANYYYKRRIDVLEKEEIPRLVDLIKRELSK